MEDEKIVNEIKSAADKYEIKTSADDIMKRYLNEKNAIDSKVQKIGKKKIKWIPFSIGAVSTVAAAVVTLSLILPSTPKSSAGSSAPVIVNPQEGISGGTRSQTAFQVFSSVNLVNNLNSSSSSSLLKRRNVDESTFKVITSTFDTSYSTVEQLLSSGLNIDNKIEKGYFKGKYKNYEYRMTIEVKDAKYIFLSNMSFNEEEDEVETEYYGEIVINEDESWKVQINEEKELKDDELEIEMQININDNERINIEQEYEQDEREYIYTYFKNGKQVYKEEIGIEKNGGKLDECSLIIEKNNTLFTYNQITMSNSGVNSSYKYEDYEGEFFVTKEGQNKKFVDKETSIEIKI